MSSIGRRPRPDKVYLNVYDLSDNSMLYPLGLGAYHSGLEIQGEEWTFASGGGIFNHPPRAAQGAVFREAVYLGEVSITRAELQSLISRMKPEWPGMKYNMLTCNCNHFADALSRSLVGRGLPGWVNRLSYWGSRFSCLLPASMTGRAPVDQAGAQEGYSGVAGARRGSGNISGTAGIHAFSGQGQRLNGGGSSTASAGASASTATTPAARSSTSTTARTGGRRGTEEQAVDGVIAALYSSNSQRRDADSSRGGSASDRAGLLSATTETDARPSREALAAAALRRLQAAPSSDAPP